MPLLLLYKSSGCPVILSPRLARLSCNYPVMIVAVGPRINCVQDRLELGAAHCCSDRESMLDAVEQAAHSRRQHRMATTRECILSKIIVGHDAPALILIRSNSRTRR